MGFRARTRGLLIQLLDKETLVYDEAAGECHVLNKAAAMVWKLCDGKRSPKEIADQLSRQLGLPEDEKIVELALQQLVRAKLIVDEPDVRPARAIDRRSLIETLGLTARVAILLPLIESILAPFGVTEGEAQAFMCVSTTPATTVHGATTSKPGKTTASTKSTTRATTTAATTAMTTQATTALTTMATTVATTAG
jgi:hypothetical protein